MQFSFVPINTSHSIVPSPFLTDVYWQAVMVRFVAIKATDYLLIINNNNYY